MNGARSSEERRPSHMPLLAAHQRIWMLPGQANLVLLILAESFHGCWLHHIRIISPDGLQEEIDIALKDYLSIARS